MRRHGVGEGEAMGRCEVDDAVTVRGEDPRRTGEQLVAARGMVADPRPGQVERAAGAENERRGRGIGPDADPNATNVPRRRRLASDASKLAAPSES